MMLLLNNFPNIFFNTDPSFFNVTGFGNPKPLWLFWSEVSMGLTIILVSIIKRKSLPLMFDYLIIGQAVYLANNYLGDFIGHNKHLSYSITFYIYLLSLFLLIINMIKRDILKTVKKI